MADKRPADWKSSTDGLEGGNPFRANDLRPGAPIWNDEAEAMKKVIDQANHYLKILREKNKVVQDSPQLRVTDAEIRNLERLKRAYFKTQVQSDNFGKSIQGLATAMGGGTGAGGQATRFIGSLSKMFTSVEGGTGKMMAFGKSLGISAVQFNLYVAAAQIAVGALVKFLDTQDKLRIRQARMMKEFGSSGADVNIRAGDPHRVAAQGIRIGGPTGEKAALDLQSALLKMRIPVGDINKIATERGGAFDDLTKLTAGGLSKTPQYLTSLRGDFAKRGNLDKLVDTMTEIGTIAQASGAPLEQFVDQLFSIGNALIMTGASFEDAERMMAAMGDAVGKFELPMAQAVDFINKTLSELHTGAGVDKMAMAAAFTTRQWDDLPKELTDRLQSFTNAQKELGGKNFKDLDTLAQVGVLRKMGQADSAEYGDLKQDVFYKLLTGIRDQNGGEFGAGGSIVRKIAPELGLGEWETFANIVEKNMQAGAAGNEARDVSTGLRAGGVDALAAKGEFLEHIGRIANLQKTFTDGFISEFEDVRGKLADMITGAGTAGKALESAAVTWQKIDAEMVDILKTKGVDFNDPKAVAAALPPKMLEKLLDQELFKRNLDKNNNIFPGWGDSWKDLTPEGKKTAEQMFPNKGLINYSDIHDEKHSLGKNAYKDPKALMDGDSTISKTATLSNGDKITFEINVVDYIRGLKTQDSSGQTQSKGD